MKAKVALCLPYYKVMPAEAAIGIVNLIMHKSDKYEISAIVYGTDCRIDRNRTTIATKALKSNPDYLMWIDDDCIVESIIIDRLLKADKDVVSPIMFYRTAPHSPHTFYWDPEKCHGDGGFYVRRYFPHEERFQVDGVGFSCVLMKASVFKDAPVPYFKFIDHPENPMGEDLYFCLHLREKGIEIWVDPTIQPKHISTDGIGIRDYESEVIVCRTRDLPMDLR